MKKISDMSPREMRAHYNGKIKQLSRYRRDFETEMNIKNNLYSFILGKGLYKDLVEYSRGRDMAQPGGHERTVDQIGLRLPENMN